MAMLVCCPTTLVQTEIFNCRIDCCQYVYEETTLGTCVLIFVVQYKKHSLSIIFRRNTFLFSAFSWKSSKTAVRVPSEKSLFRLFKRVCP